MTDIVTRHININCPEAAPEEPPLAEGDYVRKRDGAKFEGYIDVIFKTRRGLLRCVVEATTLEFEGNLHIFNLDQLVRKEPSMPTVQRPLKTQADLSHKEILKKTGGEAKPKGASADDYSGKYSIKPHDEPSHEEIMRKTK